MYASGLKVIIAAYQYETEKTGRIFVIRMRNGRLEVLPYQRNSVLYVLADQIRTSLTTKKPYSPKPASVLTGIARLGKGKHAKRIRHTEYRAAVVRRIGKIHREKNYGRVTSRHELREQVRRDLAKMLRYELAATVQHQGIPFIRRGDGIKLDLAGEGFHGAKSFVYVTAARHQVQVASYTSEFDVTTVDPFRKDQKRLEKEARERARQKRKRRRGHHG
jgi:Arc/MetJ family transcription regulator